MAPLIDCVLLLLVFFMLTASYVNRGIPVELPSTRSSDPLEKGVSITVDREGNIFLDGSPIELNALREQLSNRTREDLEQVVLRADRGVAVGRVVEVIDIARELGSEVSLVTEPGPPAGE